MTSVPSPEPAGVPSPERVLLPNDGVGRACVFVSFPTERSRYRESTLCEKHTRAALTRQILENQ